MLAIALIVVLLLLVIAGLSAVVLFMMRLLRALEGVERAVWSIAEQLHGGVGLRLGPPRPLRAGRGSQSRRLRRTRSDPVADTSSNLPDSSAGT